MSATSGITVSDDLTTAFGDAVDTGNVRFLKISIRNESLVLDEAVPVAGLLSEDFGNLSGILEENVPAYILAKLDEPSSWLAISYVPDTAKVRDKMLYASTRNNLTKSLGSAHFKDNLFATSKEDVTADAYKRHLAHLNAPKPMSEREKEMAAVKAAEREAGGLHYEGSQARRNPLGSTAMGFKWEEKAEEALKDLASSEEGHLVVLSLDSQETVVLQNVVSGCAADTVGSSLPPSNPCYAFFSWPQSITSPPRRIIVFIYSCPSTSPVKSRMVYSTGFLSTHRGGKAILEDAAQHLVERKIETSDPKELNEEFFKFELGLTASQSTPGGSGSSTPIEANKTFARPKGPGRKR
ncbi:actin depolymerizing protein [Cristinia sonorae]|uniref:Actin depolymerizing protein n=1 Tax=Cristinia sonorae TaxID=1940300 RepID=A0A8K0UZ82_9AGAR|nr:actin depolymerizing protein [Cristinia sonorae]